MMLPSPLLFKRQTLLQEVKVQLGMSKFNITMPAMQCESGCKDAGAGDIGHIPMDSLSHFPLTVMINNNEDDPRGIPKEYQDDFIAQFKDTPALKSLGLSQDATAADLLQKIAQIIGYVISPWVAYFAVLVAICISPYGCNKSNEGDCACQCCGNPKCSAITMFVFGAINLAITALAMHAISNVAAGGGGISTGSGSGPAEAAELLLAAASSSTGNHEAGFCGAVATLLQTILSKAVIPIDIPTEFKGPGGVTLPEECIANVNFICIGMVEGWPTGGFGKNDTVVPFPGTCESSLPADLTKACHDTGSGLVIWVVSLTMVLLVSVGLCFKPIDGKVDDPHAYGSIA
jgi:hypothetical protein